MACSACSTSQAGNSTYYLPVKVGEPLTTASDRARIIGSIPQIIRLPWFTLSNDAVAVGTISNAGISNTASFFKTRKGVYSDKNGQLSGSNCN